MLLSVNADSFSVWHRLNLVFMQYASLSSWGAAGQQNNHYFYSLIQPWWLLKEEQRLQTRFEGTQLVQEKRPCRK